MTRIEEIAGRMREKTTEELSTIWIKNDREEWSDDAFKAIKAILTERSVSLPQQTPPLPPIALPDAKNSSPNGGKGKRAKGRDFGEVGVIVGIGIGVFCSQVLEMGWAAGFSIGCVLAVILRFAVRSLTRQKPSMLDRQRKLFK